MEDDELSFNVERIHTYEVRGRRMRPQNLYLIKWLGYGHKYKTWELEHNLSSEILKEYQTPWHVHKNA